jgi:5-(carboxyamino)imidazole ribonucleotide synthase
MQHKNLLDHKIGILGGGQLGKMLAIEAANWHLPIYILDQDHQFPAVPYAPFFQAGDFKNFDDVVQFELDNPLYLPEASFEQLKK